MAMLTPKYPKQAQFRTHELFSVTSEQSEPLSAAALPTLCSYSQLFRTRNEFRHTKGARNERLLATPSSAFVKSRTALSVCVSDRERAHERVNRATANDGKRRWRQRLLPATATATATATGKGRQLPAAASVTLIMSKRLVRSAATAADAVVIAIAVAVSDSAAYTTTTPSKANNTATTTTTITQQRAAPGA